MRVIKFRVWEQGRIWPWEEICAGDEFHWVFVLGHGELMQFTGLTDKNGKDIYEGDIVHYVEEYIQEDLVKWSDGAVEYVGASFTIDGRGALDEWGELEVIGNIYENPELLVQK